MPSWAKLKAGHQLSLIDHSCDVASVLEAVLQQCSTYRRRLATSDGLDDLDGVQISRLSVLAFLHDYGKANRGFQNHQFRGQTPKMPTAGHVKEALVLVTHDACIDRFVSLVGWDKIEGWGDAMPSLLFASLSHHGDPVGPMKSDSADARWWDAQAFADLGALGAYAQEHWPEAWGSGGTPLPATPRFQHLFAGLVALADWVGSDLNFFPIYRPPHDDPLIWSRAPAATAVRAIGLASGRVPADAPSRFAAAFGFSPRALQERCEDIPLSQITVIEDETGSGKTEAALWLWRRLHDAGLVDGAYLALPTRSASTELHGRIQRYIREDLWGAGSPACVLAVPGYIRADDYRGTPLPDFDVQWDDNAAGADRHRRWAAESPRRFLAAYFATGTIDQVLLSALRVTHSSQRASVLSRSLLVIDELHASDAYMGQILLRVVEQHVACGGYVLALSATLGSSLRAQLLGQAQPSLAAAIDVPYPAVHVGDQCFSVERVEKKPKRRVAVSTISTDDVTAQAMRAYNDGAKVLVIRNTVDAAVDVFIELERLGVRAILHHSRYGAEDRIALDAKVLAAIGKVRSPGAIVIVGTQTLEQSLDLDADALITDLCPMDVLLQRIGRLHRHERDGRPCEWSTPRAFVMAPPDIESLIKGRKVQGLGLVYADLRIIQLTLDEIERRGVFAVPDDCRELIELTTHPDRLNECSERSADWRKFGTTLDERVFGAQSIAAHACISRDLDWQSGRLISAWEVDEEAATRLGIRDCRVKVDWCGAHADRVSVVTVPGRWIFGIDSEDVKPSGEWRITTGTTTFRYGTYGLRR